MGKIRAHLAATFFAASIWTGQPGLAGLADTFTECVGRVSAEMEHAWLIGDPAADELENQRRVFLSLAAATIPEGQARQALAYRIEVKLAHASLLAQATFGQDANRSLRARRLARRYLETCQQMLLDS